MPFLALNASVLLVVVGVLLAGQRWNRARIFREKMGKHWKVALTLAVIYFLAFLLGTGFASGMFLTEVIGMFGIFCLSLLGTTLAHSIGSFEPFPVTQALRERKRMWSRLAWSLGVALLAVPVALVLGIIGTTIASSLFHESIPHTNGSSFFPMGNQSFVNGVQQDKDAVLAGLTLPWSTGPVEGQVNRLKLIKRSMYGRAKFDLLKRRVLHHSKKSLERKNKKQQAQQGDRLETPRVRKQNTNFQHTTIEISKVA